MTIDMSRTVEPQDIDSIELECRHCHAKTVRKLDDKLTVPLGCGNCSKNWFLQDSRDIQDLRDIFRALQSYRVEDARYVLRFHLGTPPKV
jgi:hypothetical protein